MGEKNKIRTQKRKGNLFENAKGGTKKIKKGKCLQREKSSKMWDYEGEKRHPRFAKTKRKICSRARNHQGRAKRGAAGNKHTKMTKRIGAAEGRLPKGQRKRGVSQYLGEGVLIRPQRTKRDM